MTCGSFPERFNGIALMGKDMSVERIMEAIDQTGFFQQDDSDTFCELMVHPGYSCTSSTAGCGDGPDKFACSPEREHEARVLQQPQLKILLQERRVTLIS